MLNVVFITASGLKEIESIPQSTKNAAKSLNELGASPQIPIFQVFYEHRHTCRIKMLPHGKGAFRLKSQK